MIELAGLLCPHAVWSSSAHHWTHCRGERSGRMANGSCRAITPHRRVSSWPVAIGVAAGLVWPRSIRSMPTPRRFCSKRAAELTARHQRTVWFAGHWGFQFYCERAGMRQVVPGRSLLLPGDYLVLPIYPDDVGYLSPPYRFSVNRAAEMGRYRIGRSDLGQSHFPRRRSPTSTAASTP